ncbi:MAG: glycosyltransferase family 4 protein [Candidatus Omnitrophota bacterium]
MLCRNLIKIAERRFGPRYFYVDSSDNLGNQQVLFNRFISCCDIVLELPGRKIFKNTNNSTPIIFFALGYLTNPYNFFAKFYHRLLGNNSILCSSNSDLKIWSNLCAGIFKDMAYYLPWPLDTNMFKPRGYAGQAVMRKRFNIPASSPLILYAGRISFAKNVHFLIKTFKELLKIVPQSRLCLAGREDNKPYSGISFVQDKDYLEFIKHKCRNYGISDKVIFTGQLKREELTFLYSTADILINLTTDYGENFGYAQVEAMACATPVICTDWGGLKDTVIHGKTGYRIPTILTDSGVTFDWQKGLSFLIELLADRKKLLTMSNNCIKHVKNNFSFERIGNLLEKIILDTLKRKIDNRPLYRLAQAKRHKFMGRFLDFLYEGVKDKDFDRRKYYNISAYSSDSFVNN